jgi:hypothetical protein
MLLQDLGQRSNTEGRKDAREWKTRLLEEKSPQEQSVAEKSPEKMAHDSNRRLRWSPVDLPDVEMQRP